MAPLLCWSVEKKSYGAYHLDGKQGKRVYTIGLERSLHTIEAPDPEKRKKGGPEGPMIEKNLKIAHRDQNFQARKMKISREPPTKTRFDVKVKIGICKRDLIFQARLNFSSEIEVFSIFGPMGRVSTVVVYTFFRGRLNREVPTVN